MQTTSEQFTTHAQADIRPLTWRCFISFEKEYDAAITFFTIGVSAIGGGDFIPGNGDVVQEWDKYIYDDFTNRIMSIEWSREVEQFASITMGMADIVLDNHDDYFTTGSGSAIDGHILPYRPVRLLAGFGDEAIPVFIGLTARMPIIDEVNKTATFHCIDYMYSLMNRPLLESSLYTDMYTDEILDELFQLAGLTSVQLELDHGLVAYPYVYFKKDTKLITAVKKLLEVEAGRIYMDENGVIHFKNRQNYTSTPVHTFTPYKDIIAFSTRKEDEIINVVEIKGAVKEVRPKQAFYYLDGTISPETAILVPANSSAIFWAEFQSVVTSVDTPVISATATTSNFSVNRASDGSSTEDTTDVTVSAATLFTDTYKLTFANSGNVDLYVYKLELFGTPVADVETIFVREEDATSIAAYDERILSLSSEMFQSRTEAESRALSILHDWSTFGGVNQMQVKGSMAFQLDDTVRVNLYDNIQDYKITKITNQIKQPARYTQILWLRKFDPDTYFTIGVSAIGGSDVIAP